MKPIVSLLLVVLLWLQPYMVQPVESSPYKDISLDLRNASPQYKKFLKPYMINARKKMEKLWDDYDPREGEIFQAWFIIEKNGQIGDIKNITPNPSHNMWVCAANAIVKAQPFDPLPDPIPPLLIQAIFKSRPAPIGVDKSQLLSTLAQAAIAAGVLALAGYGIYQLAKMESNNNRRYNNYYGMGGYTNPNVTQVNGYYNQYGTWVNPYTRTLGNNTQLDNLGTKGNYNIYTDKWGNVIPTH